MRVICIIWELPPCTKTRLLFWGVRSRRETAAADLAAATALEVVVVQYGAAGGELRACRPMPGFQHEIPRMH